MLREALIRTHNYMKKQGDRDLRMESMIPVIEKTIPLRAHAHRADDIMTAIRIAKEFLRLETMQLGRWKEFRHSQVKGII